MISRNSRKDDRISYLLYINKYTVCLLCTQYCYKVLTCTYQATKKITIGPNFQNHTVLVAFKKYPYIAIKKLLFFCYTFFIF